MSQNQGGAWLCAWNFFKAWHGEIQMVTKSKYFEIKNANFENGAITSD